jgi:periplasmic protein TonB
MSDHRAGWIACRLLAMGNQQLQEREARLAGFFVVLAAHGVLLYSLWHYKILPPPSPAKTVFVSLLRDPPKPEPLKPEPPKLEHQPMKPEKPIPPPPQDLVMPAPVVLPTEPPPTPPVAQPVIEAPVDLAPPAPPPAKPVGPVALSGELAIVCPQRTPPPYPAISRRLGEEGKVFLRVELDETGKVDRVAIQTSSGHARLDDAALSAVRHWRCNPARRDGVAVRGVAIQPFNFVLQGR